MPSRARRSGTPRSPDGRCCARGLCPLITTLSVPTAAPVIAEAWLRSGKTGSGRGAARQVKQAIGTARAAGAIGTIMLRGDSAFGTTKVIAACLDEQVEFSLALTETAGSPRRSRPSTRPSGTPVHYPGAVLDPDTGALISDAEVAETTHTLAIRGHGRVTAWLVVRRVRDANSPDGLFPVWRYHPFFTNTTLPTAEADLTHRKHAIVETAFADLIDGPLAHIPSGLFAANCAWLACAVITHNLLRAAGTLAGGDHAVARGATLRRDLITVPARFAAPARKPMLHLPAHWPWQTGWKTLWDTHRLQSGDPTSRMNTTSPTHPPSQARPRRHVESWCRPADHSRPHHCEPPQSCRNQPHHSTESPIHGFRLSRTARAQFVDAASM